MATDAIQAISELLHDAGETHHIFDHFAKA